ncbi:MAG: peroxiredoxin [Geminicoccaceae bacterium]|nr:MAG: peroxiredoxin [Geminicoccaceae bacterium]
MTIAIGDTLPAATFKCFGSDGLVDVGSDELFGGKKVALFAVPGAFTPTCHAKHVPGYVEHAAALKAKGIDTIVCIAVNDPFVMKAWSDHCGSETAVTMLSDGNATFTKAIGMDVDLAGPFLGTRSKRYAMVVDNGKVTALMIEENPGVVENTGAEHVLAAL